jgi:glyoxylase-like metal-dependent hydrolase (beta-lactamase superfamily II)
VAQYEIYALKYAGPFLRRQAFLVWLSDWDAQEEINYYIWLIRNEDTAIVVDAGVEPGLAAQRELTGYVSPARILEGLGLAADRVEQVILTHLHWDHMAGFSLFPQATFYIQETEFEFWTRDPVALRPPYAELSVRPSLEALASLEGSPRLVLLSGDREIRPGIESLLAPGHTPGLQAVAVETARGTAVLGSDCAHVFRNYSEDRPSALITDLPAWLRSFDKLKKKVSAPELLFPGHDAAMKTDYPEIAEGVTRLV